MPSSKLYAPLLLLPALAGCGGEPTPAKSPDPKPVASSKPAPLRPPTNTGPQEETASDGCPSGMLLIDGGTLWMGSPKGQGAKDEQPTFESEVQSFCLDKHEVTLGDYESCVANGICDTSPKDVQLLTPMKADTQDKLGQLCVARLKTKELPVNCVSYDDAVKYCEWKGFRLPHEMEIEFVATGGEDKLTYPWGNGEPSDTKVCWNRSEGPCPVGSKAPQAFGVMDIIGNLREWTQDYYGPYPKPPDTATKRAVRGGSFKSKKVDELRGKRRDAEEPLYQDVDLGFRCARSR